MLEAQLLLFIFLHHLLEHIKNAILPERSLWESQIFSLNGLGQGISKLLFFFLLSFICSFYLKLFFYKQYGTLIYLYKNNIKLQSGGGGLRLYRTVPQRMHFLYVLPWQSPSWGAPWSGGSVWRRWRVSYHAKSPILRPLGGPQHWAPSEPYPPFLQHTSACDGSVAAWSRTNSNQRQYIKLLLFLFCHIKNCLHMHLVNLGRSSTQA